MNPTEDDRSLEDIVIEVEDIRANTVAETSRTIYRNSYARFLTWLACNKQLRARPNTKRIWRQS